MNTYKESGREWARGQFLFGTQLRIYDRSSVNVSFEKTTAHSVSYNKNDNFAPRSIRVQICHFKFVSARIRG